jgi:serine/threonine-protein kinase
MALIAGAAALALVVVALGGWLLLRAAPPPPADLPATLVVVADPAGARITLDGLGQSPSPSTIPNVTPKAQHLVKAELDGYEAATQTVTLDPAARREITLKLEKKAPAVVAPTTVTLTVATTPPGAKVTRTDTGEVLGVTPLAKTLVASAGEATLRLELDRFETVDRKVVLGVDSSLEFVLKAAPRKPGANGPKKPKSEASPDGIIDPFAQ